MSEQRQLPFETHLDRREFLATLAQASAAAMMLQSTLVGRASAFWPFRKKPASGLEIFTEGEAQIILKIINGFVPPSLPIRQELAARDPDYDLVQTFERFIYPYNDEFVANIRTLVNFINIFPTLMPLFFSSVGLPTFQLRRLNDKDATRFFLRLRDSSTKSLRSLFQGAKVIGLQPIYVNEKVTWREIGYPGPWLLNIHDPDEDRRRSTSFDMAVEIEDGMQVLRRNVIAHDQLRSGLTAAAVREENGRLLLESDVVVIGSGAGGSVVAAELAARTDNRVLVLEKGSFIEPKYFLQREQEMVPRIYDVEFSSTNIPVLDKQFPTMSSTVVRGKLVGGSATINHALAFEIPQPVVREWAEVYGAQFTYEDLQPHFDAIRQQLRIQPVLGVQLTGNNLALKKGAVALGVRHHGVANRNAHQCFGCGFCDMGCRYNRKLTPLNVLLPMAARHGAQVIPNCSAERIVFEDQNGRDGTGGRKKRVRSVLAQLTDERGEPTQEIEIRAQTVVLSAGPMNSPRVLQRSGLNKYREQEGAQGSIGERLSLHAPITFYGGFDQLLYPSAGGPPMSYYCKFYESSGDPDPDRDQIAYAIEGIFNQPMAHSQLMPFESPESHHEFMKRYNYTMTVAIIYRDKAVGRVSEKSFDFKLAEEDKPGYLEAIRTGARIMFAAGAKRVFFSDVRPLILDGEDEIETKLTREELSKGHMMVTSGHPMGGCALGSDPKRDVVNSFGKSWDVDGLYVADASIFPTALGTNPCFTVYALSRFIAHGIARDMGYQV